ncbi:induced myeloid leukemia cell differentiation protein Mcl-1 [Sorex fumeus]|uniref:induced myeloid leukemia cell differentiation protein Mcl-1 n=1 Tax=Sorex fumeus TaxID=62283 RepID=UPI0024AD7986|nr:induced myeloid leukemia cell differentiation protein Mcl-1 [Sorex fumeus]
MALFGLTRNAVIGLNLYCGGAGLGAGGGGAAPAAGLPGVRKEARGAGGGGGAGGAERGGGAPSPPAARRAARPAPVGAEGPGGAATPGRRLLLAPPDATPDPALASASAAVRPEDELDGYDEPEAPGKRPAGPGRRRRAGAAGADAEGSLPSTPPPADADADPDADPDPGADALYRLSLEIISRYLREQAAGAKDAKGLGAPGAAGRKALETLRRVGDGVQRNHETAFQGMLRKLDIKNEDDVKSLSRVMVHVFNDGVTNWGRIVTLISFGAFVAKHLKSIDQEGCIEPLAESITDVLVGTKRDWLLKQRGWDGFVEFFHVEDLEGGIRNVLLAFAGVAGVGAGLAYLIR